MKKQRLHIPWDMYWFDDQERLHQCQYLICEDGCPCEHLIADKIPNDMSFVIELIKTMRSQK